MMNRNMFLLLVIIFQFKSMIAFANNNYLFKNKLPDINTLINTTNDVKPYSHNVPFSTKIIPYQNGFIVLGYGKIRSIIDGHDAAGFIQIFNKNNEKEINHDKRILFNFKKVGMLGGILDKEQKNLIFYGYSEALGIYDHFQIPPEKLKYNSVFIGKYNIEQNKFYNITLLDNNSITTPNTLIMDSVGNFYFLYSLETNSDKLDIKNSAAQINLRTNRIKLVKLNNNLEKIDEKVLQECKTCNLSASGLVIDHDNIIYCAILKNSNDLILKTERSLNNNKFSG